MNISEFRSACNSVAEKYHNDYMKWLKTQDLTKPTGDCVPKPDQPTFEITKSDERDLMKEDIDNFLFNWCQPAPITLNGEIRYGVKIIVKVD